MKKSTEMTKDELVKFHEDVESHLRAELSETIIMIKSSISLIESAMDEHNYEDVIENVKTMYKLIDFSQLEYDLARILI